MRKLLAVTVLGLSMVFGFSSMALAANTNGGTNPVPTNPDTISYPLDYPNAQQLPSTGLNSTKVNGDSANDNGLINANKTGVGVGGQANTGAVNQAVAGQRTHGEYQNNTNSCASCHQTHTAAAENLLFKNGVYATCTACHDGTLGVLDVFSPSTAGTFGGTKDGNASMHLPTGVMENKAAPGGNHVSKSGDENKGGTWEAEFTCASCHSPHGSYSDRLLNYNPNGIGSTDMYFPKDTNGKWTDKDGNVSNEPVKTGGLKVVDATVTDTLPEATATSDEFVVYKTTSDSSTLDSKVTQEANGTKVIVLMKKKATTTNDVTTYSYIRDLTPWINDAAATSSRAKMTLFKAGSTSKNASVSLKLGQAYVASKSSGTADIQALDSITKADISRAVVVKFDFASIDSGTFNGIPVKTVDIDSYSKSGYGVQISTFCASCHIDYFVSAGTDSSEKGKGIWSKAFRHNTTSDNYTCLKCHFAHGSDVNVILDAKDQNLSQLTTTMGADAAKAYLIDKNPSSALKRYTNMSVCWKCHTSSHSGDMINNTFVNGINSSVLSSTEYNTQGTNLPSGFVNPLKTNLPYINPSATEKYVTTANELTAALANTSVNKIALANNITLTDPLLISRKVTLDGAGYTLTLNATSGSTTLGLGIFADATVKNLVVTTTNALNDNLVEVAGAYNAVLENVTIKDSAKAGLTILDGAKVDLVGNITLTGNKWGGIEVESVDGTNVEFTTGSKLTYTKSKDTAFANAPVVWVDADVTSTQDNYVTDTADVLKDPALVGSQVWWQMN